MDHQAAEGDLAVNVFRAFTGSVYSSSVCLRRVRGSPGDVAGRDCLHARPDRQGHAFGHYRAALPLLADGLVRKRGWCLVGNWHLGGVDGAGEAMVDGATV